MQSKHYPKGFPPAEDREFVVVGAAGYLPPGC